MNHPTTQVRRRVSPGRTARRLASAVMLITVLLVSSGCATEQSGEATVAVPAVPGSTADPAAPAPVDPTPAPAEAAAAGNEVDSCTVLTAAEVQALIGKNTGPKGAGNECVWTNEDNYYSVTMHIGEAGTAANGKLPDPLPGATTEAGPDGIRFSSGEVADFLIGDRACFTQLVTLSSDVDRANMVKLIGLVRGRVTS